MTDSLLAPSDKQERFSEIYVSSVAVSAGYTTAKPDLDRDGIDLEIRAGGRLLPRLEVQLKATFNLGTATLGSFKFPLKVRNYNLLREDTLVPRILVVYDMPRDQGEWARFSSDQLVLRRCAYWVNLQGFPETSNGDTITVDVPAANCFNATTVRELMEKVRTMVRL